MELERWEVAPFDTAARDVRTMLESHDETAMDLLAPLLLAPLEAPPAR